MNDIDTHAAEVIRFETSQILARVGDAVRKAQEDAYRLGKQSTEAEIDARRSDGLLGGK